MMVHSKPPNAQIVALAESVISGRTEIIKGCRSLVQLFEKLDERNDELFAPLIAIESETEGFPLGEARSLWAEDALAIKDKELDSYISEVQVIIIETCKALVNQYSDLSRSTIDSDP